MFLGQEQAIDDAKGRACFRLWRDSRSELRSSRTSPQAFRRKGETVVDSGRERLDFGQSCSLVLPFHLNIPMNSISVSFYLQKEPVVCPQCGSTVRVARDLCLRCMLLLGIAACCDTSKMLEDAISEIDVQDAEHFVSGTWSDISRSKEYK